MESRNCRSILLALQSIDLLLIAEVYIFSLFLKIYDTCFSFSVNLILGHSKSWTYHILRFSFVTLKYSIHGFAKFNIHSFDWLHLHVELVLTMLIETLYSSFFCFSFFNKTPYYLKKKKMLIKKNFWDWNYTFIGCSLFINFFHWKLLVNFSPIGSTVALSLD